MSYFKTCPHCGANLDPSEKCDCIGALRAKAFDLVMQLTPAQRDRLLSEWGKKMASRSTADQSTLPAEQANKMRTKTESKNG